MGLDERRDEIWCFRVLQHLGDEEETVKEPEGNSKLIRKKTGVCGILEVGGMCFKKEWQP